ncbi:hypothetical protein GQ53DRAFT_841100 [Thozetella sp. PMI_491]|nr:hypothetical protein GQ53DRAFT_841100 [Thozetella sp. PMI_491]
MPQELGLSLLYEPPPDQAVTADIVFVHGLGGGYLSTWASGSICWPRDLLKQDFPGARIFSKGYDSKVFKIAESGSRTSIAGQAESLLNDLARSRRDLKDDRPIVFVCHSLGGLVVKQALVRSFEHYHSQQSHTSPLGSIFLAACGVIFMGTPHRGSSKATLGKIAAKVGKIVGANDQMLKALENDSALLEQQRNSFDSIRRNFFVVCLWEDIPMPLIGLVVPEASACIDGSEVLKEHIPGRDHRSMARFASRTDKGYMIVLDYIKRALQAQKPHIPSRKEINQDEEFENLSIICEEITSQCIWSSFSFDEINNRFEAIAQAHRSIEDSRRSTYDWIFQPGKVGFAEWLQDKGGLFWINGKAGSGKSTLMKFIASHLDLKLHGLSAASASTSSLPLDVASYFFWAAGTGNQKSHQGLFRTILFSLLRKKPQMVQEAFPKKWASIYPHAERFCRTELRLLHRTNGLLGTDEWQARALGNLNSYAVHEGLLKWSGTNFLVPLKYVLSHSTSNRTLLLIDGLDEYEGSEDDLEGLVAVLQSWATFPNTKVCVSTRPWAVFETNFGRGQVPSLRLQDLTVSDIKLYVSDSFKHSNSMNISNLANPHTLSDLQATIVKKAEGVFLWVYLVARSLKSGLRNGDETSILQQRVNELPSDLDDLYRHLVERIPNRYWSSSFRLFSVVKSSIRPPKALLLWHVGERGYEPLEREIGHETQLARCYQLYLRLMSQCAGLLELRSFRGELAFGNIKASTDMVIDDDTDLMRFGRKRNFHDLYGVDSTVHYLHRTARDFLAQEDIEHLWRGRVPEPMFDSYSWLATRTFIDLYQIEMQIQEMGSEHASAATHYERGEYLRICLGYLMDSPNETVIWMLSRMVQALEQDSLFIRGSNSIDEYTPLLGPLAMGQRVRLSWLYCCSCLSRRKEKFYLTVGEDISDRGKVSRDIFAILKQIDSI